MGQGSGEDIDAPVELVLGPADCRRIFEAGELSRLTMVLRLKSVSPVVDGGGGVAPALSLLSSSSESSITLRLVIASPLYTQEDTSIDRLAFPGFDMLRV